MWRTLDDLDVTGKRVLWRVDFNVSIGESGRIDQQNDWRMRAALPTLETLLKHKARVIAVSHLGEPAERDARLSLAPVASHLSKLAGQRIRFVSSVVGPEAVAAADKLEPGEIMMLENVRFEPGEIVNDPKLADQLAAGAEMFVCDAFGVAHRPHASLVGLPARLPSAAGELMCREVKTLADFMTSPPRPAVVILGGAKVGTKLAVLARIMAVADYVLLGGVLANTVLAAKNFNVGASPVDKTVIPALQKLDLASSKILLPQDATVGLATDSQQGVRQVDVARVRADEAMYDLGERTIALYQEAITGAASVVWNGPMGLAEVDPFATGTVALAEAIAGRRIPAIVGGGDTVAFLMRRGLASSFSHISTGGGAMLAFLAGERLPALEALGYYS
ncbi:phosphoglycerate kinase [Candidatus Parcubacteria bacterium]|nr:phosphoglycerate kinase [Candidatus Parcubacteria bacterium]